MQFSFACQILISLLVFTKVNAKADANPGKCIELTVHITATGENVAWAFPPFETPYETTHFFNLLTQRDGNASALVKGTANVTGSFLISAHFCTPTKNTKKKDTVQILSHGLGFDKSYWDFNLVPGRYSYINTALAAGYSTFSYDRIGVGASSSGDPYSVIQAPLQVAILVELTKYVRSGAINGYKPSKVVHIGHSFGSAITNGLVSAAPGLSDGIILTSFSHNSSFTNIFLAANAHAASASQPARFSKLSNGFVSWGDQWNNQFIFFAYPGFDPKVVAAAESRKWPFTVGEALTVGALPFLSPKFTGPVLMLAAQHDLIFCGYDCTGIIDGPYAVSPHLFPASKEFATYTQPGSGHGINLHLNATGAYKVALDFLARNGL